MREENDKKSKAKKTAVHTKRQQGDTIFALDIGTRTVVGVLAEKTKDGFSVIDMETAAHKKRSVTDGQIEDIEAVADVISAVSTELEKRRSIKLTRVCVAAAGRALKTARMSWTHELDPMKPVTAEDIRAAELETVRKTEESFSEQYATSAFYCVGHSVVSLSLDGYKSAKPEGHRGSALETEIIAAFLPAYVVESLCAAVDMAGLEVAGLTLEPIAAMNVVVPPELRLINIALCDIGAGTSDVAISRGGSVVAYGMATTAGDEITESLMDKLLVDFDTAERIKTSDEDEISFTDILLQPRVITAAELSQITLPAAQALADTICGEITEANGESPQAVFLVGGGSKLKGLPALVAKGLGIAEERVAVGRRELMRGITAPKTLKIGTEHATPLGIAITTSDGVSYDFTTITLNGRTIRALDTNRLTVFELMNSGGIKPDKLMGKMGESLTFTLSGERITLRGTPAKPGEITVNGEPAALNSPVRKGDDVRIIPAENGENASARLSDYFTPPFTDTFEVVLLGEELNVGTRVTVNGQEAHSDIEIRDGDDVRSFGLHTLGELLSAAGIDMPVLLNGEHLPPETKLREGDVITPARPKNETLFAELSPAANDTAPAPVPTPPEHSEQAEQPAPPPAPAAEEKAEGISISFNGIASTFPPREDGRAPIFLDIAAAFADDPTSLLKSSSIATVNGKVARLDEEIHDGDVIVIE